MADTPLVDKNTRFYNLVSIVTARGVKIKSFWYAQK